MKTQIESAVLRIQNLEAMNTIAHICIQADDGNDLYERMQGIRESEIGYALTHVKWGFGHNHFWMAEDDRPERVLFVDFTAQ